MPLECMLGSVGDALGEILPEGINLTPVASLVGKVLLATTGGLLIGAVLVGLGVRRRAPRYDSGRRGFYRGR